MSIFSALTDWRKVGVRVRWITRGRGARTERRGLIICTVKPLENPRDVLKRERPDLVPFALRMAEEKRYPITSFLVHSDETGHVYWPDPQKLEKV